jgi:hypothetical protein
MKPYLVLVPSPRGPQPQVWYKDGRRFVTPSDIRPIAEPIELPRPMTITEAVAWARAA